MPSTVEAETLYRDNLTTRAAHATGIKEYFEIMAEIQAIEADNAIS